MQLVPFKSLSGSDNMKIDELLLQNCSEPVFRLYSWNTPTLSLGRNQKISSELEEICNNKNIPIVKRITGGRALLHDKELTYSFCCNQDFLQKGENVLDSYKEISQGLVEGFKELGIELEFPLYKKVSVKNGYCMGLSTGSDLSYQGKKFIGSAQCRKGNCILQHGSILIDYDKELLSELFDKSLEGMVSLREINPELCDSELLCNAVTKGFESVFKVK